MKLKNLTVEYRENVALITLNRPDALNALNTATFADLESCLPELDVNPEVHVIIITGAGKAFVAGADIAEMKNMSESQARKFSAYGQKVFMQFEKLSTPIIAAINGFALGGGCELAMACDIRIASEQAKLGQPEVNLGVIPGFSGTQRLARLVGEGRAKELIFTAEIIDAATAREIGLVNQVVPAENLMTAALEMAEKIAGKGPNALKYAKEVIHKGLQLDLAKGTALENTAFGKLFGCFEANEGMTAFLEKRKPNWG